MGFLFNEIVYRPLYNLLVFVYNILPFHDFGIAIIIVTLIIKFILVPLSKKQIESQKKMQEMQPKIKEIQEKYKKDKEKQTKALMEFYKTNKANPLSGCLPTVFQLIFLIAIYRVLFNISQTGLMVDPKEMYSFIGNPGQINQYFLGLIELSNPISLGVWNAGTIAQWLLIIAAAASQYFQMKMIMPAAPKKKAGASPDIASTMSTQMMYIGPLLTLFIGVKFPSGLALYWLVSTVFAIIQQNQLMKDPAKDPKKLAEKKG